MSQEARTALAVLAPAVAIAALFLLSSWRPWQRGERLVRNGFWGGPCALGLGFIAAFFVVDGSRGVQLQDRWHLIAVIVLISGIMGFVAAVWHRSSGIRIGSAVAMAGVCVSILHPPAIVDHALFWKIGLGVTVLATWTTVEPIAVRRRGVIIPITGMIMFTGLSIVLLETHQAVFSLLAAPMAAMCGVAFIIALLNPHFTFASGGTHVVAAVLPTLCALGWFYNFSDVPVGPFVLILVSSLMLWLGEARFTARLRPWQGVIVRATLAALPIAAAVVWTLLISQAGADEYGY